MRGCRLFCGEKYLDRALRVTRHAAALASLIVSSAASGQAPARLIRYPQKSGTHETLLAVSAFSDKVAWASGTRGTILHTTDGGNTWKATPTPSLDSLDFQNVYAINGKQAFAVSVGQGRRARIYKTMDGGAHWIRKYMNTDVELVWRCFGFWNADHLIGISDVQKGDFLLMYTIDGGETWDRVPADSFPAPLPGERTVGSNPAACVRTGWFQHAWFATSMGRVIRTSNYGDSWKMSFVHMAVGDENVINSLLFHDASHGLLFGERKSAPGVTVISETSDAGKTWAEREPLRLSTPVASISYVPDLSGPTVVAVGERGSIYSRDYGLTWIPMDEISYTAVAFVRRNAGWAVGMDGRITKITF